MAAARRCWTRMKLRAVDRSARGCWMCHVQNAFINGRLAHQRIPQPLLPDYPPRFFVDYYQRATLGVERNSPVCHYCGCGSIIYGLNFPNDSSRVRVHRVEFVGTVSTTNEEHPVGVSRSSDGPS